MRRPAGFDSSPAPSRPPGRGARTSRASSVGASPRSERGHPETTAPERNPRQELRAAARRRRRAERAELRRFTRTARRRRTAWLVGLAVTVTILGGVTFSAFSPLFAVREFEIVGTSRLDPAVIGDALEGELGTPLVFVNEDRLADELGGFHLIRSFVVEISPPGTVRVLIDEREPVGVVVSGEMFQLVDPAGVVVESSVTRPEGFPIIVLPPGDEGVVRRAVGEVLRALPAAVREQLDRVSAQTRDDIVFSLIGSEQTVVWGSSAHSERKAVLLAALFARHATAGPGEYDVSAPGTAVFRAG